MNARYLLLASTLLLAACGTETEVQVASGQSHSATPAAAVSATDTQQTEVSYKPVENVAVETTGSGTENSITAGQIAETAAVTATQPSGPLLPLGRLVGIVDAGDYRQATIDNQGKVIRLREGDDWQGWTVKPLVGKILLLVRIMRSILYCYSLSSVHRNLYSACQLISLYPGR